MNTILELKELILAVITVFSFFVGKRTGIKSVFKGNIVSLDNGQRQLKFGTKRLTVTRSGQYGIENLKYVLEFVSDLITKIREIKTQPELNVLSTLYSLKDLLPGIVNLWKYGHEILAELKDINTDELLEIFDYAIKYSNNTISEREFKSVIRSFSMLKDI